MLDREKIIERSNELSLLQQIKNEEMVLKNRDFVQVYNKTFEELEELIDNCPAGAKIVCRLAQYMTYANSVTVGFAELASIMSLSKPTLRSALKTLEELGWIIKTKRSRYGDIDIMVYANKMCKTDVVTKDKLITAFHSMRMRFSDEIETQGEFEVRKQTINRIVKKMKRGRPSKAQSCAPQFPAPIGNEIPVEILDEKNEEIKE